MLIFLHSDGIIITMYDFRSSQNVYEKNFFYYTVSFWKDPFVHSKGAPDPHPRQTFPFGLSYGL